MRGLFVFLNFGVLNGSWGQLQEQGMTTEKQEAQPQLGEETVPFEQQNLEESGSVEETPEPEIDWQARYEAESTAHDKTRTDRRSQDIELLSRKAQTLALERMEKKLDKSNELQAEGRAEEIVDAHRTIDAEYVKQIKDEETQALQSTVNAEAMAAATELGIDANESSEFDTVRLYWQEATRTGEKADYEAVRREIQIAKGKVKDVTHKDEIAAAVKRGQEQERKAMIDESGALETDTGNSAPGGSGEIDVHEWAKLPAAERLKTVGKLLGRE